MRKIWFETLTAYYRNRVSRLRKQEERIKKDDLRKKLM